MGISAEKASKLFIYYGLSSAIGRLLAGILCNHKKVNTFFVFQAAEVVAGLSTILVTLTTTYTSLVIYVAVYGLSDGFFFTSLSVILLTASPLKTAAVLGWEMMLTSAFLASGPPLAGKAGVLKEVIVYTETLRACLDTRVHLDTHIPFGQINSIWTQAVHLDTCSPFAHREPIWTQEVHLYTEIPFGNKESIWTQEVHLDTEIPFGHKESIWTQEIHLYTEIPFGNKESIWTQEVHLDIEIPFGHKESILTQEIHLYTEIPFGNKESIWTQKFHLETRSPFRHRESFWTQGVLLDTGSPFGVNFDIGSP